MSPRRRVLFALLAAMVVAVVALVTIRSIHSPRAVPDASKPGTVLLVPGYGGAQGSLETLAASLRAAGRTVTIVTLPDGGTGDLNRQADALDDAATRALKDAPSVDVVGYSAGGIVVRLWVQHHDGVHKARRIVTLGSPHHGAQIAAVGAAAVPGACPTACQQLVPGNLLLTSLTTPVPSPPQWLAVRTADDQTVTPPDSAVLDGAVNVEIQSDCPGKQVSHGQLPSDPWVMALVRSALSTAPLTAPPPKC